MQQPPIYLDINNNKSIINALKAGEEYVFDAVYRHYFRRLCAFCSQYVSEQEEIEEIVQDTMMWLWENRCNLMEELTLKTLLFTIVKNKALNRISHFEIRRKVHQEITEKFEKEFVEQSGVKVIIGKGGMGPNTEYACKNYKAIHCVFPAGNAVVAATEVEEIVEAQWRDLGMPETLWHCHVKEFGPLIVSIDTEGRNLFEENKVIFNQRKDKAIEEICKHVGFIK